MRVVMVECAAAVMASLSGLGYAGLTPPYKRLGWASLFWRASAMPWMFLMAERGGAEAFAFSMIF